MRTHLRSGFTIVELLIVVVVIAILAAIVVVAYNGIRQRAVESSVQSSVKQASTKIESYFVTSGDLYPPNLSTIDINDTDGTTYSYSYNNSASPKTYCISATNGTTSYHVTESQKTLTSGACNAPIDYTVFGSSNHSGTPTLYNDGTDLKVATLFYATDSDFQVKGARVYLPSVPPGVSLTVFYVASWHIDSIVQRLDWPEIPSGIPGQYATISAGSLVSGWNSVTFPSQATINQYSAGVDTTSVWVGYYFSSGAHYIHTAGGAGAIQSIHAPNAPNLFIAPASFESRNRSAYTSGGSVGWTDALYGIDIITGGL